MLARASFWVALSMCIQNSRHAAGCVFPISDGFEVAGIYARRVAAQMIDMKSFWNFPDVGLIGGAMRGYDLSANAHVPIAESPVCSDPKPAAAVRLGD